MGLAVWLLQPVCFLIPNKTSYAESAQRRDVKSENLEFKKSNPSLGEFTLVFCPSSFEAIWVLLLKEVLLNLDF